jgi:hypothetical protein
MEKREMKLYRTTPITLDVDAEIRTGLELDGVLTCSVESSYSDRPIIANHDLRVKDRTGALVAIDWDDLSDTAQERIERQVLAYFDIGVAA